MSGTSNQSSAAKTNTDGSDTKYYNDSQNKKNSSASNNVNSFNIKPNQKQNKNNRINMASNNVAPLRQQNFNSVSTEPLTQQQNTKSNGGSKKQNKKKTKNNQNDANKPDENVVDTNIRINDAPIQQVISSEMTTSERLDNTSLNSEQTSSTFTTSQILENFETHHKDSNKIFSDVTTTASLSNNSNLFPTKTEEVITEDQQPAPEAVDLSEEAKPAQLNESETSLEFTSCCSTPMSHNDTKLSTNKETVSLEKVIASLDFKSNDMLAIDMDQFDHSNEDDEQTTTCIEGYNERQEEAQISVIEAKKNENNVPFLSCSNDSKTNTLITLPTMDCPGEAVINGLESHKHELEVTNQVELEKLDSKPLIHLNGNLDEDHSEIGQFKPDLVNESQMEPVISQLTTVSPALAEEVNNERETDQCESEINSEEAPYVQMKMLQEEFAGVESNLLETVETIQNEMDSLVKTQLDQSKKLEEEEEEVKVEEAQKVEVNHFEQETTVTQETEVGVVENQSAIDAEFNSVESVIYQYRTEPAYEIKTQNDIQKSSFKNNDESNEMTLLLKKNESSAITPVQLMTEEENKSSDEINSYINNIITSAVTKIEEPDDSKVSSVEQEIKINENKLTDQINMQYIDEETTENNLILNDDSSSLAHKQVTSDHEHQADEELLGKEAKLAEKNDSKTKKTNKKSAEPPVDCFPCSIL